MTDDLLRGIIGGAVMIGAAGGLFWQQWLGNEGDDVDYDVAKRHLDLRHLVYGNNDYAQVCQIIQRLRSHHDSPIGQLVSDVLSSAPLVIRDLRSLSAAEYRGRIARKCQCCRHITQAAFLHTVHGLFLSPHTIFLDLSVSAELIEETIVHEAVHYHNYQRDPEMSDVDDEFSAYRAEDEFHGKVYLTRQFDQRLRERVMAICHRQRCPADCASEQSNRIRM